MKGKLYIFFIMLTLITAILAGCGGTAEDLSSGGFPDLTSFTAQTLEGGEFTQADLAAADINMINVWGTYCGPCLREMPELAQLSKAVPENVRLMTFCIDAADGAGAAREILDDAGFEGVTLISGDGDLADLLQTVQYVPTTLFVDNQGRQVGEAVIGAPSNATEFYTQALNDALQAIGKDGI